MRTDSGRRVPPAACDLLEPWFAADELSAIRLHHRIPRYVPRGAAGYANCNRVYLAKMPGDAIYPRNVALLAHELVHCRQYRTVGKWTFRWRYLVEYLRGRLRGMDHTAAYRAISFEREARTVEAEVLRALLEPKGALLRVSAREVRP